MTDALTIADAGNFGHMNGWGWGMMGFGWVIGLVVIGVLVWAVIQATQRWGDPGTAEATLADRFARGEIDDDEYRRRLAALRSQ
jgi:putative membrane protein